MRLSAVATLAANVALVHAFKDTFPFILLSSKSAPSASQSQLQSYSTVVDAVSDYLASCPTDNYLIVSQPGISASDLSISGSATNNAGHLRHVVSDERWNAKQMVSEVVGLPANAVDKLASTIQSSCEAMKKKVVIVEKTYDELPSDKEARGVALRNNDIDAFSGIRDAALQSYTILYLGAPSTQEVTDQELPSYDASFDAPLKMDLKRDLWMRDDNTPEYDPRPLFEKYQFLSPGLFMGLFVTLILGAILSVGISAVSSLQVSYGAFEKEMGPAAQKKQQ